MKLLLCLGLALAGLSLCLGRGCKSCDPKCQLCDEAKGCVDSGAKSCSFGKPFRITKDIIGLPKTRRKCGAFTCNRFCQKCEKRRIQLSDDPVFFCRDRSHQLCRNGQKIGEDKPKTTKKPRSTKAPTTKPPTTKAPPPTKPPTQPPTPPPTEPPTPPSPATPPPTEFPTEPTELPPMDPPEVPDPEEPEPEPKGLKTLIPIGPIQVESERGASRHQAIHNIVINQHFRHHPNGFTQEGKDDGSTKVIKNGKVINVPAGYQLIKEEPKAPKPPTRLPLHVTLFPTKIHHLPILIRDRRPSQIHLIHHRLQGHRQQSSPQLIPHPLPFGLGHSQSQQQHQGQSSSSGSFQTIPAFPTFPLDPASVFEGQGQESGSFGVGHQPESTNPFGFLGESATSDPFALQSSQLKHSGVTVTKISGICGRLCKPSLGRFCRRDGCYAVHQTATTAAPQSFNVLFPRH